VDPVRFDRVLPLTIGNRQYDLSRRVLIVGLVNRTHDALFDDGKHDDFDTALRLAEDLASAGADIIDVGGIRAVPGTGVSPAEEIERVVPAIAAIVDRTGLPVSVDTIRASVAEEAYRAGAVVGSDISGFADPEYLAVAQRHNATVVATHIRLAPQFNDPGRHDAGNDVVGAVERFFIDQVERARAAGLEAGRVIIDPGIDLGKTTQQSVALLGASRRLASLGPPLLLSVSNTGFLGEVLGYSVGGQRDAQTAAIALGVTLGCRVLRVHDVEAARRVCRTLEAVLAA
jgi:dihydropteroate synthase